VLDLGIECQRVSERMLKNRKEWTDGKRYGLYVDRRGRDVAEREIGKDQAGVRPEDISLVDQRTGRVVKVHSPRSP